MTVLQRIMLKGWKKKNHKEQKERKNHTKKCLRATNDAKQNRSATSAVDMNLTSCLKKLDYEIGRSVFDCKKLESDSKRVSKELSISDSIPGRTVTTCGCSSRSKTVQFDAVEIRQYERIASDNPCCSSGPPIG